VLRINPPVNALTALVVALTASLGDDLLKTRAFDMIRVPNAALTRIRIELGIPSLAGSPCCHRGQGELCSTKSNVVDLGHVVDE
jgi:hypothetical protein